jgi:E3 ubiquitin-protein ligase RNF13
MLLHLISILLSQLKSNLFSFNKSFTIILLSILVFRLNIISADIAVISSSNRTVDVFVDFELGFAASVPSDGITGRIVVAEPEDACNPIASPPETNRSSLKWFVLIKRYSCDFKTKVQNAMRAGFHAAIIYNIDLTAVKKYSLVHSPQTESGITIPAVLVSFDDGWTLKKEYLWDKGFYVMILPDLPFNLNAYLLPFAIVIGVCLLLMISFMVFRFN